MAVLYRKYQNQNSKSRAYLKWYGKSVKKNVFLCFVLAKS